MGAAAAYVWDESGDQPWNVRYAKNFWHLPIPDQPLSDITLANGIHYRCTAPQQTYELTYDDPDGDDLHISLTYQAVAQPNYLGQSHLDQPGRYRGTIVLEGSRSRWMPTAFATAPGGRGLSSAKGTGPAGTTTPPLAPATVSTP